MGLMENIHVLRINKYTPNMLTAFVHSYIETIVKHLYYKWLPYSKSK